MTQARNLSRLLNKKLQTYKFTATSGQTSFADSDDGGNILSYTPDNMLVTYNGVVLENGSEYTATNGTSVVLDTGADSAAEVNVYAFESVSLGGYLPTDAGGTIGNSVTIDASGQTVLTLDRATSDGTIIDIQKDGSTVGSIGSYTGGNFYIGTPAGNDSFILFADNQVSPATSTGAPRDAGIDFGNPTRRFKDLYLSGGVYVGGTGAANYLDDYEEGTWTPEILGLSSNPTVNYSLRTAYYTKIGRQVTVSGIILLSSLSGGSGNALIGGLPFTVNSSSQAFFIGTLGQMEDFTTTAGNSDGQNFCLRAAQNTTYMGFIEGNETSTYDWQVSNLTSTFLCRFNVTYFTN